MALHIRDFRASDAAGLSGLEGEGCLLGRSPAKYPHGRILCGLREGRLVAAAWMTLADDTGLIPCLRVEAGASWQSDVRELLAEACLWLASRGAAQIELGLLPDDRALLAGLLDMDFTPDRAAGVMRRPVPARSAA